MNGGRNQRTQRAYTRIVLVVGVCLVVGMTVFGARRVGAAEGQSGKYWAYIGTYTGGDSQGIYVAPWDAESGQLGDPVLAAETENPSFLAIHPNGKQLYCVNEIGNYENLPSGSVTAFTVNAESGQLTRQNTQSSRGAAPCHLVVDAKGRAVLVANYTAGNVVSLAIEPDGSLGGVLSYFQHSGSSVNKPRQREPHAHSINLDAANRFAFAADLGTDRIYAYRYDADAGRLLLAGAPASPTLPPGSGPRHFAFHPSGMFAYVINELLSTIEVFSYDAETGLLTTLQNLSTLPDGYEQPSYTAEVVVHPSGKFVYGSNRGHDSIAVFQVDQQSGNLTRVQVESTQGRTPRNFVVDPTGRWLLAENQGSDSIVVFAIDPDKGTLAPTGQSVAVPSPVCVKFLARP